MARVNIVISASGNDVHVLVEVNGRWYDEVEFHKSEIFEIQKYLINLVEKVIE